MTISAKELEEKLKREKTVEVKGMAFTIRKVSLLLLLEDQSQLWEWARAGQAVVTEHITEILQSPTLPAMRRVILAGAVEPRIVETGAAPGEGRPPDSVSIDLILSHYDLAAGLFCEIVNLSLGG
mgnify:FL=1